MKTIDTPVLVVGGGPAGLTTSLALSRYGISHMLVSKYPGTANSPRAHITNQGAMEVFRDLGVEQQVLKVATRSDWMGNNAWATGFNGTEIGRLSTWGQGPERRSDYDKASPTGMCNIGQHLLEPILLDTIRDVAVADVRFNHELQSFSQDEAGVLSRVLDRASGEVITVRSQYLVGADGARSQVVEGLELTLDGEMGLGHAANVWFEADLSHLVDYRPSVLYWMLTPGNDYWVGSGTFINVKPWTEWVMLFMYDLKEGEPVLSEATVKARIARLIGDDSVEIKIKAVSQWQINHIVAQHYSRGRVFCVGDAVHRHPPANGLGSNTSVQDGFNLAWKLKWVLEGKANPRLLESYSAERQPVGRQVVDRAMQSVGNMAPIPAALGFEPGQTEAQGWDNLHRTFAPGEDGRLRRQKLAAAIELQNYQFNAHGVELGQRYGSSAVVPDGTPAPEYRQDPELYYQASTWPGCRLPHAWLNRDRTKLSTHDIVGKGEFTLLTGIGGEAWQDVVRSIEDQMGIHIDVRVIGAGQDYIDCFGDWERLRGVDDDGCVLVRPDHFVAWRARSCTDASLGTLPGVIEKILGRS
uniref:FAD-dependent monooxygenase n=1 Tax=Marinobacterium profundum TaxID=1714300 RepID=UPI00082F0B2A|nr:FAD-dependent monooxygenase [Marinobacterium profundum]